MMKGEPGDKNTIERDAYRFVIQQVKVLQGPFWLELAGLCMANYFFTTLLGKIWQSDLQADKFTLVAQESYMKLLAINTKGIKRVLKGHIVNELRVLRIVVGHCGIM